MQSYTLTSWRKSATFFLSGQWNPINSKKSRASSRGPWYTIWPSDKIIISSNSSYVSGAGWRREITVVPSSACVECWRYLIIWYVVELSSPVEISSMKSTLDGPTNNSPIRINKYVSMLSTIDHFTIQRKITNPGTRGEPFLLASRDPPEHFIPNQCVRTAV